MVTITPSSLMITSGQSSTLTCKVAVVEYLVVEPAVQWTDSNGQEVGGVSNTIGTVTTSELTFTELATSQAGPYTCRGRINVPSVDIVDRDNSDLIDVIAQSKYTILVVRVNKDQRVFPYLISRNAERLPVYNFHSAESSFNIFHSAESPFNNFQLGKI